MSSEAPPDVEHLAAQCRPASGGDELDAALARRLNRWGNGNSGGEDCQRTSRRIFLECVVWTIVGVAAWIWAALQAIQ
jgi:hypothetical protein